MDERDTEQQILDAAHTVFLERGTAGARMREVAEEAGVNQALLHYYFRSKEQLAQAVFQRALGTLFPRALEVLLSDAGLEEKVRRIVELQVDTLRANPFLPGYLLGELTHHPARTRSLFESAAGLALGDLGERVRSTLGEQLAAEARAGRLREIEAEQFVMNLIGLVIFPFAARPMLEVTMGLEGERFDEAMELRKERIPEFFMNGLRP